MRWWKFTLGIGCGILLGLVVLMGACVGVLALVGEGAHRAIQKDFAAWTATTVARCAKPPYPGYAELHNCTELTVTPVPAP